MPTAPIPSWLTAVVATTAAVAACHRERPPNDAARAPTAPAVAIARDTPLPHLARQLLAPRMRRHAIEIEALQAAVLSVDRVRVVDAARAILAEPRLARPSTSAGDTLNDALPETFFTYQDDLVAATRAIAAAAADGDDAAMARAYGDLNAACVGCHAVYRDLPGEPSAP